MGVNGVLLDAKDVGRGDATPRRPIVLRGQRVGGIKCFQQTWRALQAELRLCTGFLSWSG